MHSALNPERERESSIDENECFTLLESSIDGQKGLPVKFSQTLCGAADQILLYTPVLYVDFEFDCPK